MRKTGPCEKRRAIRSPFSLINGNAQESEFISSLTLSSASRTREGKEKKGSPILARAIARANLARICNYASSRVRARIYMCVHNGVGLRYTCLRALASEKSAQQVPTNDANCASARGAFFVISSEKNESKGGKSLSRLDHKSSEEKRERERERERERDRSLGFFPPRGYILSTPASSHLIIIIRGALGKWSGTYENVSGDAEDEYSRPIGSSTPIVFSRERGRGAPIAEQVSAEAF